MAGEINFGILNTNAPAQIAGSFQAGQEEARQNKLAQLAMRQQEQAFADDQLVRQAYKDSGGDQNKLYGLLNNAGAYKEANAVQKTISDQQKAKIDNAVNALKLVKHHAATVFANPTMDSAMAALQTIQQATGQDQSAEIARLQATGGDPEQIRRWASGHAMEADKLLPHFQQFSNGAAQVQGVVDPLTGKFSQNGAFKMQQSPDSVASNAIQIRGQNLTDARGREANRLKAEENSINKDGVVGKRVQDVELKLQDDYRAESKGFSETSTAMKKVLGAIETADKNPGSALAAGTAFMKILDPNSVVRESELGMALNASGWFDRAINITITLQSGQVMTPQQKQNLKAAANDLFKEAKAAQREIDSAYEKRTKDYGGDPRRVIVDRGQNILDQPPGASNGGASAYSDPGKEARYQAWKAKQGAK